MNIDLILDVKHDASGGVCPMSLLLAGQKRTPVPCHLYRPISGHQPKQESCTIHPLGAEVPSPQRLFLAGEAFVSALVSHKSYNRLTILQLWCSAAVAGPARPCCRCPFRAMGSGCTGEMCFFCVHLCGRTNVISEHGNQWQEWPTMLLFYMVEMSSVQAQL